MSVIIRSAMPGDQEAIVALVRSERLNPTNLRWPRFVVAAEGAQLVGAAQLRRHGDGSRELGSLVIAPPQRGRGLAARMIDTLLAAERGPVHMVTGQAYAAHYARWGFRPVASCAAPRGVRQTYWMGRIAGGIFARLQRRAVNTLIILGREPPAHA